MSDASISIKTNLGNRTYEANSQPLETKTLGMINLSDNNDFSVPFQIPDGPKVYFRPDQVDAIRMASMGNRIQQAMGEDPGVTISVNGTAYALSGQDLQTQLNGKGYLM